MIITLSILYDCFLLGTGHLRIYDKANFQFFMIASYPPPEVELKIIEKHVLSILYDCFK